jgi:hypothetical protein
MRKISKAAVACLLITARMFAQETEAPTPREKALLDRIDQLEHRLAAIEQKLGEPTAPAAVAPVASTVAPAPENAQPSGTPAVDAAQTTPQTTPTLPMLPGGTTLNVLFDGYYDYNFNYPIGRVNLLRAYDVLSNSFNLNQADVVIENAPDAANGKRWGARVDLQWGQATETLQGNPANEPRPGIYQNIFQAFGTYVFPVANNGLTIDFGKWSSSLGIEGNYNKDQINYSRSYWFDFLPFYHEGLRAAYKINDQVTFNYWMDNGTQQTEAFNNYKDELFGFTIQPAKTVTWNVNYYLGQEHPDTIYNVTGPTAVGDLQGVGFTPIVNPPKGKLDILDSYAIWQTSPKWTVAAEADYVVERYQTTSAPVETWGGALYARDQVTSRVALGARAEYMHDGGLFSGVDQALKETTFTFEYKLMDNLIVRDEWRRDFSNHPYFYTSVGDILKKEQNTATMGLIFWFGQKAGSW